MSDFFFSIIIPSFNSSNYIVETLNSIANQTYKNFEVLIIDDHSTDNSRSIASEKIDSLNLNGFVLSRPITYPKGVSSCRNFGIENAKGDWICFLDSDDLFHPEKLEKIKAFLIENNDCQALFHGMDIYSEKNMAITERNILAVERRLNDSSSLLIKNLICTSTVSISKDLIKKVGKFSTLVNGVEDYYCWLLVSKLNNWYYHPEALTIYRVRDGSLMRKQPISHYMNQTFLFLNLIRKNPVFNDVEYNLIRKNKLLNLTTFHTNHSVNDIGVLLTIIGLFPLVIKGHVSLFFKTAFRLLKNQIYLKLSNSSNNIV